MVVRSSDSINECVGIPLASSRLRREQEFESEVHGVRTPVRRCVEGKDDGGNQSQLELRLRAAMSTGPEG